MFGNAKSGTPAVSGGNGALSVIGSDVAVKGDIATEGNLHVDGVVEGDIACGMLVQGAGSRIAGAVRARTARIAGAIEGSIDAAQLSLERSARVKGDVAYAALAMEDGAIVNGQLTHADAAGEPALRLVEGGA